MRQARILDVLRGVTAVAAKHPEIESWWYAPPVRLRLRGQLSATGEGPGPLEVVVQADRAESTDCGRLAAELSKALLGRAVSVRMHRGGAEERHLFRMVSRPRPPQPAVEPCSVPLTRGEAGA